MNIEADHLYHIFNQGNRRLQIFDKRDDYLRFLTLVRKHISPHCIILAYCLMPNHFHFLIQTSEKSIALKKVGNIVSTELSNGFRMLQSSYAQVVNHNRNETGSLFKQKAQAKEIREDGLNLIHVFNYIHQNPVKALLVNECHEWEFSSFKDFAGIRNGTLCDKMLVNDLTGLETRDFHIVDQTNDHSEIIKKYFLV